MNILTEHFGLDVIYYTTWNIVSKVPLILKNTTSHTNTDTHIRKCSSASMALHSFKLKIHLSLTAEVVVLQRCGLNFSKYPHAFTLK